jgi:hypothetical protein
MMKLKILLISAALLLATPSGAESPEDDEKGCSLTYSEVLGEQSDIKKYEISEIAGGFEIKIAIGDKRRMLRTAPDLTTIEESYWNTENSDRVEAERKDGEIRFHGRIAGETIHSSKEIKDHPWFGSVLLLKEFVLSGEKEILFYVTKPEEEKAVLIKAIHEGIEKVTVDSNQVEAVKVKFTVPDIRGLFWKSYYWYRAEDGILVKTEETRGPPGTPKARVELLEETRCEDCGCLATYENSETSLAAK